MSIKMNFKLQKWIILILFCDFLPHHHNASFTFGNIENKNRENIEVIVSALCYQTWHLNFYSSGKEKFCDRRNKNDMGVPHRRFVCKNTMTILQLKLEVRESGNDLIWSVIPLFIISIRRNKFAYFHQQKCKYKSSIFFLFLIDIVYMLYSDI